MSRLTRAGLGAVSAVRGFLREVWKGSQLLLTYGEVIGNGKDKVGGRRVLGNRRRSKSIEKPSYNGLVTSVGMFVFLTTFVIILFVTPYVSLEKKGYPTKLTLIIFMLVGSSVMLSFSRNRKTFLSPRNKPLGLRGQLVLIGITIFFVIGSFLDLFNIISVVKCLPVYINCNVITICDTITSMIFHSCRVIYLAEQTAFCILYRGYTFKDRCLSRYGLMFLHTANLAMWFDVLLRQTAARNKIQIDQIYWNACTNSTINHTTNFESCVFLNGTFNDVVNKYGKSLLSPFLFQLSLLVLECFIHWFVQCGTVEAPKVTKLKMSSRSFREKMSSYRPSDQSDSYENVTDEESKNDDYSNLVRKCFLYITMTNILFGLFNLLPFMVDIKERSLFNKIFAIYCIIYWCLNIIFTFLGYYCTTAFKDNPKKKKFRSLNYLLIVSAIGPYVYVVTALETVTHVDIPIEESVTLLVLKEITFFISVFCQIPFCFLAGRVALPTKRHEKTFRVNCFKAITLHLAISNGVLWIVDSLTSAFIDQESVLQISYYQKHKWGFIDSIIQPLTVFFRFNSFLLFTAAHARMTPFFGKNIYNVE